MAENKFFDKINLEHYHRYVSGMIKRLSDNIDERIDEKFKNFIEDNVSDGEILDSRGGERTLGDRLNKFDEKYSEVSSQLAHIQNKYLSHYSKSDVDCIPKLNDLINNVSLSGGGCIIVDDIFTVNPTIDNFIIPKSNVEIKGLVNKVHGFKVIDGSLGYGYLIKGESIYENFTLNGLLFDMNYVNNNSNVRISHYEQNTDQCTYYIGDGENIDIKNCKFISCGINTIATQTVTKNINIKNNDFEWAKHTFSDWYDNSVLYIECDKFNISNNFLYSKDVNSNGGIEVHGGNGAICYGNNITGFSTGINITSPRSYISSNSYNQLINNNIIDKCEVGIRIWATDNTNINNLIINNNIVKLNQLTRGTNSWCMGIGFQLQTKGDYKYNGINISNNIIEFEYEEYPTYSNIDMCGGISIRNYGNETKNINISNNTIKNCPFEVFNIMGYGKDSTNFKNINIINNIIDNFGSPTITEAYNTCFLFNHATYENLVIKNNTLNTTKGYFSTYFGEHIKLINCDVVNTNNNVNEELVVYPYNKNEIDNVKIKNDDIRLRHIPDISNFDYYVRYGDLVIDNNSNFYRCTLEGRPNNGITKIFTCNGTDEVIVDDITDIRLNDCFKHSDVGYFRVERIKGNVLYLNRPVYKGGSVIFDMVNPVFTSI